MIRYALLLLSILVLSTGCRTQTKNDESIQTESMYIHEKILSLVEDVDRQKTHADLHKSLIDLADYAYKHHIRCSNIQAAWELLKNRLDSIK